MVQKMENLIKSPFVKLLPVQRDRNDEVDRHIGIVFYVMPVEKGSKGASETGFPLVFIRMDQLSQGS